MRVHCREHHATERSYLVRKTMKELERALGSERFRVLDTGPTLPWAWGHESGDLYLSSPLLGKVGEGMGLWFGAGDGLVVVGSADGSVYAADAVTGELRWRFDTAGRELTRDRGGCAAGGLVTTAADAGRWIRPTWGWGPPWPKRRWRIVGTTRTRGMSIFKGGFSSHGIARSQGPRDRR